MPSGHVTNHSSPAPWVHEAPRLLDGTHLVLLILGHDAHTGTKGGGGQTYWLGPEIGVSPAPSLGSPVVVLCARHEAQSRHGLPGHGQARGPLLQEAVPREGVAGESLLVFHHHHHHHHHHHCHLVCPEGAVVLQAAPRLAGPGGPRVDAGLLVPVEDEVIPGEVGVDVGALGQRQPVPGVDTWGSSVTISWFRILSRGAGWAAAAGAATATAGAGAATTAGRAGARAGCGTGAGAATGTSAVRVPCLGYNILIVPESQITAVSRCVPAPHRHPVDDGDAVPAEGGHGLHHVHRAAPRAASHRHVGTLTLSVISPLGGVLAEVK